MADRKALVDPIDTPEDVATLYSWANLHGAKYRDFSASRAQTRERARQRVQDAIETERRRARDEAEAQKTAEAEKATEAAIVAEAARKQEQAVREQVQKAAEQAAQQAAQPQVAQQPRQERAPANPPAYQAPAAYPPQPVQPAYVQPGYAQPVYGQPMGQPLQTPPMPQNFYPQPGSQPMSAQPMYQGVAAPVREEQYRGRDEHYLQVRSQQWAPVETREPAARPAWITGDRRETNAPVPQAHEDTLQDSRDRLTSRWFALNGVFTGASVPAEALPAPVPQRAPVLAVFSLAGGVGKTSLVATLGRALSARGEKVLLVDTAAFGLLPFFFGARDQRPGVLRTFTAPGAGDSPVQLITIDPESLGPESAQQETLTQEIARNARGVSRVIVDLATASGATTRRILRLAPMVLVPVIPDMSSVVSVSSIDAFFQRNVSGSGQQVLPYYVLNQFDQSLPLHLDVREVLREQLGDRLLPFALRRTPAVSEALAEGMTVVDYAPNSTVVEDFGNLAGWVKSLAAPASSGYRGVRWSER
ncbi:MAG TPA: cellulose biosynthesis protein BcsQ [Terracidiphilus sp.]|jgi:cellulose synthase operon protein YhjQ|nr:cellulose biosynthesis protein BcsQ [Terracidiphilus sp.]